MRRTLMSVLLAGAALAWTGAPAVAVAPTGPAPQVVLATDAAERAEQSAVADQSDAFVWSITPATAEGPDERVSFRLALEPSADHTDHVAVTNFSTQTVTFELTASDGVLTDAGAFDLLPPSEDPTGTGAWIELQEEVTVDAGATAVVPYTLRVPDAALPGDHPGGIVATLAASTRGAHDGAVGVDAGVGARIHLRVAGEITPVLALTDVVTTYTGSWNPLRPGVLDVEWTVANTGNVRLGAEQVLDVAAPFGLDPGVEAHAVGDQYEILPGDSVTLRTSVEAWPMFRLDAVLRATPGIVGEDAASGPLTAARAEVSAVAVPWPHLAALALLVLVVVGAVVRRRRRRARLERAVAAAAHAAATRAAVPAATLEPAAAVPSGPRA